MILLLLLFYTVHNIMAQISTPTAPPKQSIDLKTKPVMCDYTTTGQNGLRDPTIPEMAPECMPCECDIIVFEDFTINNKSSIVCDTKLLQRLTSVKPVIICLYRANLYYEWAFVLKDVKVYTKEVDALIDFAKKNNVIGYRLHNLTPIEYMETFDKNVGTKIVDYIKILKEKSNLIIGYTVNEYGPVIKNPCLTAFAELNGVVDFYTLQTYALNSCRNDLYNGVSPIKPTKHGDNYMMSLEELWKYVEASKCDLTKVYLMAGIVPTYTNKFIAKNRKIFVTYNEICAGLKIDEMCVSDTNELYAKGSYIKQVGCGLTIKYVNLDNFDSDCGCETFVGTKSICAGYYAKEKKPCAKFDVQKAPKGSE